MSTSTDHSPKAPNTSSLILPNLDLKCTSHVPFQFFHRQTIKKILLRLYLIHMIWDLIPWHDIDANVASELVSYFSLASLYTVYSPDSILMQYSISRTTVPVYLKSLPRKCQPKLWVTDFNFQHFYINSYL
jgi:hypothetical protein